MARNLLKRMVTIVSDGTTAGTKIIDEDTRKVIPFIISCDIKIDTEHPFGVAEIKQFVKLDLKHVTANVEEYDVFDHEVRQNVLEELDRLAERMPSIVPAIHECQYVIKSRDIRNELNRIKGKNNELQESKKTS